MHRGTTCDPPEVNWDVGMWESGGQSERVGVVSFKCSDIKKEDSQ